ncbi:hypothetical protein EMCRGX_G017311 [Ephydatia muelleri]
MQCNHLVEQIPPTAIWGKQFFISAISLHPGGDIYKIVASSNNTAVNILCTNSKMVQKKGIDVLIPRDGASINVTIEPGDNCIVTSKNSILLVQFAPLDSTTIMVTVPASHQYLNTHWFTTVYGGNVEFKHYKKVFSIQNLLTFVVNVGQKICFECNTKPSTSEAHQFISWSVNTVTPGVETSRMPNGTLCIDEVTAGHTESYKCKVGADSLMYTLSVRVKMAEVNKDETVLLVERKGEGAPRVKQRCSNTTSIALLAVMGVVIVAIGVSVVLGVTLTKPSTTVATATCNTEVCTSLAKRVLSSLDTSIDPCQDFYNFSCGGWIKTKSLPPGKGQYGMFDELSDRNQAALKALLEGDLDSDVPVTMKLRGLYQECMNINAIEALGAAPLLNVIKATVPFVFQYNWTRNIKKLLHEAGVNITDSETIIVKTPTYFTKLATLLNTINSSTTENYALWQLIHPYIRFIEVSFADAYYNFSQTVQGSGRPQRYETCISYVQSVMPMALARIYALKILPNGTKINTSSYFASYVSYVTSSTLATFANLPKTVDKTMRTRDVSGNTSPLLPNVNYNQDQLYFIAFGQLWCSLLTPSYIQSSTKSDAHSPGPVRVIGVVQNSAEFANAFNCKAGAPMNPSNKCTLW